MTSARKTALGDLALCAAVAAGAAVLLIGAAGLPPPRFDPLGSAALPRGLAVIMLAFAAWIALGAVRRLARPGMAETPPADLEATTTATTANPLRGVIVFAALVAFVAALDIFRLPLVVAATGFMVITGLVIAGPSLRSGVIYGLFGFALSALLTWVMSSFLYVSFG